MFFNIVMKKVGDYNRSYALPMLKAEAFNDIIRFF